MRPRAPRTRTPRSADNADSARRSRVGLLSAAIARTRPIRAPRSRRDAAYSSAAIRARERRLFQRSDSRRERGVFERGHRIRKTPLTRTRRFRTEHVPSSAALRAHVDAKAGAIRPFVFRRRRVDRGVSLRYTRSACAQRAEKNTNVATHDFSGRVSRRRAIPCTSARRAARCRADAFCLPWLVLAIGIPASILLFTVLSDDGAKTSRALRFERHASDAQRRVIERRIHFYASVLYGLRALFDTNSDVSRLQFHEFVRVARSARAVIPVSSR